MSLSDRVRKIAASPWRVRLLVWAVLAALVLVFFRAWVGSGLPASPRREALAPFTYIWQIANNIRAGYLYVDWDPSFFAGYPWLRFLQSTVYYIAALLSLLPGLSLPVALKLFIVATYVVSAWTMCELVHTVVRNSGYDDAIAWAAGLVAGASYAVFPFHLHLGIEIISHGAFWAILPLPFLVYEQGRSPASARRGVSATQLGVAFALYGIVDIEHALLFGPFAGLYILLRELPELRRQWRNTVRMLAVALLVALGLMAFYILPGVGELGQIGITARFGEGGIADAQFARDTGVSVGALMAGAADRIAVKYRPADLPYIVFGFFGANTWYLGVIASALALLGLARLRRSGVVAVAAFLLLLSFAWAARAWLPINLFEHVPFFGTLSGFRGMLHIAFFLCLLAGFGVAVLLRNLTRLPAQAILGILAAAAMIMDRPRPTAAYAAQVTLVVLLLVLTIVQARRQHEARLVLAGLLLFLLVAVDFRTASAAVVTMPSYFESDEIDAYSWLSAQGSGFRIWEYSDLYDDNEFLHTFSLAYNQTPRFGGYYDNGATTAQWRLYKWAKPERGLTPSVNIEALETALHVSSVRYVLVHKRIATSEQALYQMRQAGFASVAWQTPNVTILEDTAWQPLARLYAQADAVSAPSIAAELALLPAADRDKRAVYAAAANQPRQAAQAAQAAPPQAAALTRQGPYEISVQVDAAEGGVLVVGESWHPNWRVTVDGKPAELLRANVAFMGVRLDAGKHDVLYSYRLPATLVAGWAISILTVLGLLVRKAHAGA